MPAEIKFTNFGIPYLVEFANISIRSKKAEKAAKAAKAKTKEKENKPKLPPPPVRCPTCGHVPHHPPRASVDEHGVKAAKAPKPGGLYIRFESNPGTATEKISARRLVKLRSAIEEAVTNAGMLKPSPEETGNPADTQSLVAGNPLRGSDTTKKALFKGTYGQVKQALKEAGLVTVPCSENGFEHSTRLGALFVVNSNGAASDNLELTKLTLWG